MSLLHVLSTSIHLESFSFFFFFACLIKNADTCFSVSRETAVTEEGRWGPDALSASSASSVLVWSDATNSWTDCLFPAGWKRTQRLQGERSSLLLCLSAATFIHHALTVHFYLFFPGRQRFQGTGRNWRTQGEFGRNKQCSSHCNFWTWCCFMVPFSNFYFLFVCSNQGEAGFPGLSGCKGSPGLDVSP